MYNREREINVEALTAFLQDAVNKVKTQENPDVLNDLKKIYKKNVPFSLRMYVAAYLMKEAQRSWRGGYKSQRRDFRHERNYGRSEKPFMRDKPYRNSSETPASNEEKVSRPRVQIDPALAQTIFISIGRNKRVYPRDLIGMLISVAGIERDRIGDIRVLANYSFVQLFTEDAEKAIATLNGYDFRGRSLVASYSKQKAEYEGGFDGAENTSQSAEDAAAYAAATKAASDKEPFSSPILTGEEKASDESEYLV